MQTEPRSTRATAAWTLTSGEAGMRTQARGLAAAVAATVVEMNIPRGALWGLPGLARIGAARIGRAAPRWPDVVISCGRRAAPYALEIVRRAKGRTLAVHVQDPRARADRFDLVVAMDHDRIAAGPKVIKVATALHDLTPELLREAALPWRERFAALGPAFAGVIVGGDLKGRPFTLDDARELLAGLKRLRAGSSLGLAITPSRRTPQAVRGLLAEAFRGESGVFLWNLEDANPYRAILALARRLVVTGDSVSMISEAISTDRAVDVLDLGFARHAGFLQALIDRGRVRRFNGDPEFAFHAEPINATLDAARAVRRLLSGRR